jgi:hypothetical protein
MCPILSNGLFEASPEGEMNRRFIKTSLAAGTS